MCVERVNKGNGVIENDAFFLTQSIGQLVAPLTKVGKGNGVQI